jgi:hypothetical protein
MVKIDENSNDNIDPRRDSDFFWGYGKVVSTTDFRHGDGLFNFLWTKFILTYEGQITLSTDIKASMLPHFQKTLYV